ncbi:hypothetical protein LBMAG42_53440 [Deltaproteobacteria bacterium]|nr:hypothetical protein LBMAG42_53440 [Deltaproteobacteria bacterium]
MRSVSLAFGLGFGLAACDPDAAAGEGGAFVIAEYFTGVDSWTWRDDGDTGIVDDSTVLRGEMDEEGTVSVRRGARYVDGDEVGELRWDLTATDLILSSWAWLDDSSGSSTIFARNAGLSGDIVTNLQGACVSESISDFETSYGTFDYALHAICDGTPAPSGEYWFAKGFGLVRAQADPIVLDLVAPR